MNFSDMRVKDIHGVVLYNTNMMRWNAEHRKNHIVGIKLEGSALHDFGYKKFVLSRNQVYFFNQKDDYKVDVYEPGESFSINFTTSEEIDTESFCISVSSTDELLSVLKKARTANETGDSLMALSLLYRFCAELERIRQKTYFPKDKRMTDAKSYIDTHFYEKNCLDEVVLQSGITARRFCDLFKKSYDVTPNRYITLRKIEHAKTLLETNVVSVAFVAEQCGFSDIYYFSKIFKKETGILPSKWS